MHSPAYPSPLYTLQYMLFSIHSPMYILHYTFSSIHFSLQIHQCKLSISHSSIYTLLYILKYTLFHYIFSSILFSSIHFSSLHFSSIHSPVYTLQYTLSIIHPSLYTLSTFPIIHYQYFFFISQPIEA